MSYRLTRSTPEDLKGRARNFNRGEDEEDEDYIKVTNIKEFLLDAHDPNVCGNVLDLPNYNPEAPQWIR
jgi:hypothetical protein